MALSVRRMISRTRNAMANLFYSAGSWLGAYQSVDPRNNMNEGYRPGRYTANQALAPSLDELIAQFRDLDRNSADGRAGVEGFVAAVIGTGIDIEPDTGNEELDFRIAERWAEWCENAGVNGESLWNCRL